MGTPVRAPGPTTNVGGRATIAVFPGDGIGPEVTAEAVAVLEAVAPRHGLVLELGRRQRRAAGIDRGAADHPPGERQLEVVTRPDRLQDGDRLGRHLGADAVAWKDGDRRARHAQSSAPACGPPLTDAPAPVPAAEIIPVWRA